MKIDVGFSDPGNEGAALEVMRQLVQVSLQNAGRYDRDRLGATITVGRVVGKLSYPSRKAVAEARRGIEALRTQTDASVVDGVSDLVEKAFMALGAESKDDSGR